MLDQTRLILVLLVSMVLTSGCQKSDSGGSGGGSATAAAAIQGIDFSGTYILNKIECYNSALNLTNGSTFTGNFTDSVVVTGNTYVATTAEGNCTVTTTGNIIVNSDGLTISNIQVTNATGGSCTIIETLTNTNISPNALNTTYTLNEVIAGVTNQPYIWNANAKVFGIPSIFTDGGAGDVCFEVLTKL